MGLFVFLNNEKIVVLLCRYVCFKDSYVYIEIKENEWIFLGKCCYVLNDWKIESDFVIIEIDSKMEEYFFVKKFLNYIGD